LVREVLSKNGVSIKIGVFRIDYLPRNASARELIHRSWKYSCWPSIS
jgi:hypothetical protein